MTTSQILSLLSPQLILLVAGLLVLALDLILKEKGWLPYVALHCPRWPFRPTSWHYMGLRGPTWPFVRPTMAPMGGIHDLQDGFQG